MDSKLDLRPSNLQLITWNFQIQYSYLLNRSSASGSYLEKSGSAILFTNKHIRRRNIALLQACQLQILRLSIANENTRYIIIAGYLAFCVVFCWSLFFRLALFHCPLYCFSFFDLSLLIITLVSWNCSSSRARAQHASQYAINKPTKHVTGITIYNTLTRFVCGQCKNV